MTHTATLPDFDRHFDVSAETDALTCPGCGSANLVEESAGRYLCLYCHSLSEPAESTIDGQRLVVGQRLCAHCGTENPGQATTCSACGRALTPLCLKCGARMAVWHDTCPRCGTDQAAFREQLAAQARERQRRSQQRESQPRGQRRRGWHLRHDFWRVGWMVWPLIWLASKFGAPLRGNLEALTAPGLDRALSSPMPDLTFSVTVGACIFGVGLVLFLMSALPSIFRSD